MVIIKRDGTSQQFDKNKIVQAVLKAFVAVDGEVTSYAEIKAENIANYIEGLAKERDVPFSIEEIQDLVEKGLMSTKAKDVAREYITYREKRNIQRTRNSDLRKRVMKKLTASDVQNQNANVDEYSFGGRLGEASSEQARDIALNDILSEKSRYNHINNRIYIHDLDSYAVGSHNCLTIPFDKLLKKGFNTRQTDVRKAGSLNTAFQLVAVIFQLQSLCQFGGVSASHLDWTMVPYVRKSLFKHYLMEYLKDTEEFYELNLEEMDEEELDKWIAIKKKNYLRIFNLKETDFFIGSEKLDKRYYRKALFETRRELKQAVEGLYHNLR